MLNLASKVMENKRLDLDACKNKVRKARSLQMQPPVSFRSTFYWQADLNEVGFVFVFLLSEYTSTFIFDRCIKSHNHHHYHQGVRSVRRIFATKIPTNKLKYLQTTGIGYKKVYQRRVIRKNFAFVTKYHMFRQNIFLHFKKSQWALAMASGTLTTITKSLSEKIEHLAIFVSMYAYWM